MGADGSIQMGSVSARNYDWNLLAQLFFWLPSCSYNFCRGQFSVRHIRVGEAINRCSKPSVSDETSRKRRVEAVSAPLPLGKMNAVAVAME